MSQHLTKAEIAKYLDIEVDFVDNLIAQGQLAAPVDHAGPWGSPRWAMEDVQQVTMVAVIAADDTNLVLSVAADGATSCSMAGEMFSVVPPAVWEYVVCRVLSPGEKQNIPPEHHRRAALRRLHEAAPTYVQVPLSVLSSNNPS